MLKKKHQAIKEGDLVQGGDRDRDHVEVAESLDADCLFFVRTILLTGISDRGVSKSEWLKDDSSRPGAEGSPPTKGI